jgi:hypothetical protein
MKKETPRVSPPGSKKGGSRLVYFGKDSPSTRSDVAGTLVVKQPLSNIKKFVGPKPGSAPKGKRPRDPTLHKAKPHAHNTRHSHRNRPGGNSGGGSGISVPARAVTFVQASAKRMMSRGAYTPPPAPHNTNDVYMRAQSEGAGAAPGLERADEVEVEVEVGAAALPDLNPASDAPASPRTSGTGACSTTGMDQSPGFCTWEGNSLLED